MRPNYPPGSHLTHQSTAAWRLHCLPGSPRHGVRTGTHRHGNPPAIARTGSERAPGCPPGKGGAPARPAGDRVVDHEPANAPVRGVPAAGGRPAAIPGTATGAARELRPARRESAHARRLRPWQVRVGRGFPRPWWWMTARTGKPAVCRASPTLSMPKPAARAAPRSASRSTGAARRGTQRDLRLPRPGDIAHRADVLDPPACRSSPQPNPCENSPAGVATAALIRGAPHCHPTPTAPTIENPGTPRHVYAGLGNDDAGLLPATGEELR